VRGIGLLDLGNPEARAWITERVAGLIGAAGIDHYMAPQIGHVGTTYRSQ
jgi:hypothetical protein